MGKIKDGELIGTVADSTSAGVGNGIEPHQRMPKDGDEAFFDADADVGLVAGTGVAIVFDAARIPGLFGSFGRDEGDEE